MKTIATINFKGGVGKTTVTWAMAQVAAQDPKKNSLMFDLDAQMSLTQAIALNEDGNLYSRWLENQETSVREELETMSVEDLRKFADANNLNVTAKTSKERVIQLIGFRFREKKQLTHNVLKASSPS
jgi:cellulose biosynthesis protein BcsQ